MLKALDAAYWLVYLVGCIYYKYCFFYCLQFRQMLVGVPVSSLSLLGETSEQKLPWMEWKCGTARAGEGVFFCVLTDSRVISVLSYFPRDVILYYLSSLPSSTISLFAVKMFLHYTWLYFACKHCKVFEFC